MIVIYSLFVTFSGILRAFIWRDLWKFSKARRLPPGPPRKLIIGNMLNAPPEGCKEWEHWLKHKYLYGGIPSLFIVFETALVVTECCNTAIGPISSIEILGQSIINLNDAAITLELLEKRSLLSSSRPQAVMTHELLVPFRLHSASTI
jgi:hypothetical protein